MPAILSSLTLLAAFAVLGHAGAEAFEGSYRLERAFGASSGGDVAVPGGCATASGPRRSGGLPSSDVPKVAPNGPTAPIGSALSDGLALVYESGGIAQAPWVYQSVQVVEREGFERCVRVERRGQPERETCVRNAVLFERTESGEPRATRPIGPDMRLEVRSATGQVTLYETGSAASRSVAATVDVMFLPTTITTRDKGGVVVRRLREEYAPALLTALRGEFEEPDGSGGWRQVRTFSLSEIRRPR